MTVSGGHIPHWSLWSHPRPAVLNLTRCTLHPAGAWRFVQCNWGARHLVNAKEVPKPGNKNKSDSLRWVAGADSPGWVR